MNKEELLKYITQAVEALDESNLEMLFPENAQPDLNTLIQELIGLRGEVRKLAQSALKTNNDVQTMLEQQKQAAFDIQEKLNVAGQQVITTNSTEEPDDLKELLQQLIEQDDIMQRTASHFKTLPELGYFNLNPYKQHMASWKKGYEIATEKWRKLIQTTGLYATGAVGEVFNPVYHEAVAVQSDTSKSNNTILETVVLGYIRRQKLVRRAKVVVNKLNDG
jgi:molecular chaperone GrpE (heat shock protein)